MLLEYQLDMSVLHWFISRPISLSTSFLQYFGSSFLRMLVTFSNRLLMYTVLILLPVISVVFSKEFIMISIFLSIKWLYISAQLILTRNQMAPCWRVHCHTLFNFNLNLIRLTTISRRKHRLRMITKVKQCSVWSVHRWVTVWEY